MKLVKLVLASYFQPQNHGPGRKIGVSSGKPRNLMETKGYECDFVFDRLAPDGDVYFKYKDMVLDADVEKGKGNKELCEEMKKKAGEEFVASYKTKLDGFVAALEKAAKEAGKEATDILPFQDGDTLLSWENAGHMSYRTILAEYLRDIGYDVEEN